MRQRHQRMTTGPARYNFTALDTAGCNDAIIKTEYAKLNRSAQHTQVIEPDRDHCRRHISHLFGDLLGDFE